MNRTLERILPRVQKPARYTGGEYNAVVKEREQVDVRYALCFPDTYEIGMSNLGVRILYGVMNEMDGVWCERVFAPWSDMEEEMRREGLPLYGLESGDAIADFDLIGFSIGYEMAYTNLLNMLDLAELPLRSSERCGLSPIVVAGGTCVYNPEPLAPFVDIFSLGEGEEVCTELIALYRTARDEDWSRADFLAAAAQVPGLYVPSLYDITYHEDGTIAAIAPRDGAPAQVVKRIVQDFEHAYFPVKTIVPSTEIIHDRVMLEVFRGCMRGCRFCQAGYAYRPVRARSPERLIADGIAACTQSGYQEMTLSSLSTSDYRQLEALCDGLLDWCEGSGVALSLPSLRADNFSMGLMQRLQSMRKSGLTFAPEAGTQRLRDVINKNVTEEDLLQSCRTAFSGGWNAVKLYFMLGLPTETDADVLGIADLAEKVYRVWREAAPDKRRGVRITVSTSCFVPKPHTAFQWEGQVSMEEYKRRVQLLRDHMKGRSISYSWHDPETSYLEAVLARGDRRLADVLESVWRDGGRMDAWSEFFSFTRWQNAFAACGIDPDFYAARVRDTEEVLPWQTLSTGVTAAFFKRERARAYAVQVTPDCRTQCTACGANRLSVGGKCDA
ncbi:MAG: TIGR03960 family B12-binding radical SAM protein [Oscillospiraceae bacterium]|nr:TIGR03960 family B12-binding radical SAM protein [Oscillospiraceae bacterium]